MIPPYASAFTSNSGCTISQYDFGRRTSISVVYTNAKRSSYAQQQRRLSDKITNIENQFSFSTTTALSALPLSTVSSLVSSTIATTASPATAVVQQQQQFDAILPDTTIVIGFFMIVVICAIAANVWANQVVPISRTKLAIAKQKNSNSNLRLYLDELLAIENNGSSIVTTDTTTETTAISGTMNIDNNNKSDQNIHIAASEVASNESESNTNNDVSSSSRRFDTGDRAFERWLFTDWLIKDSKVRKGGRQKEPAIPILKSAKWNSGDNPVLVATTLIFLGVLFTSVTERITTSFLPT